MPRIGLNSDGLTPRIRRPGMLLHPPAAWTFSGNNSHVKFEGLPGLNEDAYTIAFWAKIADYNSDKEAFNFYVAGGTRIHIWRIDSASREGFFATGWDGGQGGWRNGAQDAITGEWVHYLTTYDKSSTANDARVWRNGAELSMTRIQTPSGTHADGTDSVYIGSRTDNSDEWDGELAEFSIWMGVRLGSGTAQALSSGHRHPLEIRPDALAFHASALAAGFGVDLVSAERGVTSFAGQVTDAPGPAEVR